VSLVYILSATREQSNKQMMALIRLVCFIACASEGIKKVVGSLPEETPIKRFAIREDAHFSLIFCQSLGPRY
jgi:hypothetical protein